MQRISGLRAIRIDETRCRRAGCFFLTVVVGHNAGGRLLRLCSQRTIHRIHVRQYQSPSLKVVPD